MDVIVLFGVLFLCITLSVPIGFGIAIATTLAFFLFSNIDLIAIAQTATTGLDSFPMMAIPFFIFAGELMGSGGVARRLVDVAHNIIGHVTGGLAMTTAVTCMFFGAISGSACATVSAIGGVMIPEMERKGYDRGFAASLSACSGTIGLIIPPSIAFVIYGVVTGTSIGDLFIAGIVPGVLMTIAICITCYIMAKKHGYIGGERTSLKVTLNSIWEGKWAILSPLIILGGIYSGVFTPTEAAVVSCVYAIIIGLFVHKELTWKKIYEDSVSTMVLTGIAMFLLGVATAFAKYLTLAQVPPKVVAFMTGVTDNPILLMLMINLFLLLVGCFIDNIPATIILSPILLPVAMSTGLTAIQFGMILTLNLTIGLVTPPYGANLFIASAIADLPMERMFRTLVPLLISLLIVLMIVTYLPGVSTVFLD